MFWEDKAAEKEFYKRIFQTEPFKTIYGDHFDSTPLEQFAKPMALNTVRQILAPNFDERLRDACLREIGKTCCLMFLEYSGINVNTDIDTYITNLNIAFRGHRRFERTEEFILDEAYLNGQCWCPILNNLDFNRSCSEFCDCGRSARETYFATFLNRQVKAERLNTILSTGSDMCKWIIQI